MQLYNNNFSKLRRQKIYHFKQQKVTLEIANVEIETRHHAV